jgi:hypothetical protein
MIKKWPTQNGWNIKKCGKSPLFSPLVPLRIAASDMPLRAKVKAAGGKWTPEEQLWYVRYGAIAGGPLETHIHIDNPKKRVIK